MKKNLFEEKHSEYRDLLLVMTFYLAAFAAFHLKHLIFSGNAPYWEIWGDQVQYIHSARAFLHGVLTPEDHWYPPLYSLLISPFSWLPPLVATLIPDLLCYILAFVGFREVARQFSFSRWEILVLFLLATVIYPYPWVAQSWVIPWTTTLAAALIWLSLAQASRFFHGDAQRPLPGKTAFLQGILLALIPLCRPADAIVSGIIGLCLLKPLLLDRRDWRNLGMICAGGLLTLSCYFLIHVRIYGFRPTGYMEVSAAFGMNFAWLGWKAYLILIEPRPWYPDGPSILEVLPWLPLGLAGMLLCAKQPNQRMLTTLVTLPSVAYLGVMLAYVDLLPSGLWRYHNFHYFKWLVPLIALFAWYFVKEFKRRKLESLATLGVVLLITSVRYDPIPAAPDTPARMTTFAAPMAEFPAIYFALSTIADRTGTMRNMFEYHQVPDERGLVMAEALVRDFAGGESWNDPGLGVQWPDIYILKPPAPLPGAFPKAPLARYRPEIRLGWPCWLPPYTCITELPAPKPM